MKRKVINDNGRDKAFLGAVIGGIANIAGGIISKRKQKKAQEEAYKQQQKEQTQNEGFQQAAAMTSQYANQDYVNQVKNKISLKNGGKVAMKKGYNDRIAHNKKFACGGRKRASLGSDIINSAKSIGEDFSGGNLANTISGIAGGVTAAVSGNNPSSSNMSSAEASTAQNIATNKEIARKANEARQRKTTAAKYGTRKKAMFGIGSAVSGIGNLIGSATQSTAPQKQVKKAQGFSYSAPKTGLQQTDYQTDAGGNAPTVVDNNSGNNQSTPASNNNDNVAFANGQYKDRIEQAKFGVRKHKKCGGRR